MFSFSFDVSAMGTKKKINYVFASNLPKDKVETPVQEEEVQNEPMVEEPVDTSEPEPEAPVDMSPIKEEEDPPTRIKYPTLEYPIGTPENGIFLCIILSLITLFSLGFLIWHEHTWRKQEESEVDVQVDDTYDTLTSIVRNYVATIEDTNKADLCKQLRDVYLTASKSDKDLESDLETIKTESRKILGFDERRARTNEHEWQKLFGSTGVIDSWLSYSGVKLSNDNKKEVFKAISEGLK